jgi:hypothetical protein
MLVVEISHSAIKSFRLHRPASKSSCLFVVMILLRSASFCHRPNKVRHRHVVRYIHMRQSVYHSLSNCQLENCQGER